MKITVRLRGETAKQLRDSGMEIDEHKKTG
jgi:hypothetical protein